MTNDKAAVLLNTLIKRTEEGRVPWTASSTPVMFEASLQRNTVAIVREEGVDSETGEQYTRVHIEILNDQGIAIDTVYPYEVRGAFDNAWEVTESLFNRARDKALGVNEAVDDILGELGGGVPLPKRDDNDEIPF